MNTLRSMKTLLSVVIAALLVSIASAKTLVIENRDKDGKPTGEVWKVALIGKDEGTFKSAEQRTFYSKSNADTKGGKPKYEAIPVWFGISVKARAVGERMVAVSLERQAPAGVDGSPDGKASAQNVRKETFDTIVTFTGKEPVEIAGWGAGKLALRLED